MGRHFGKLRCGVTEQKLKNWKCKNHLQSQLKANMVLFSSVLLNESIKKNPTGVEGISLITCYALLVGPIHSLILLKSSQSEKLSFKELYRSFPCIQLPVLADRIIIHILKKFVQNLIEHALADCCLKVELHEKFRHVQCMCCGRLLSCKWGCFWVSSSPVSGDPVSQCSNMWMLYPLLPVPVEESAIARTVWSIQEWCWHQFFIKKTAALAFYGTIKRHKISQWN